MVKNVPNTIQQIHSFRKMYIANFFRHWRIIMPPVRLSNGNGVACVVISLSLDWADFIGVIVHQKHAARRARPEVRERLVGKVIRICGSDADAPGDDSERNGHYEACISIFQHTAPLKAFFFPSGGSHFIIQGYNSPNEIGVVYHICALIDRGGF